MRKIISIFSIVTILVQLVLVVNNYLTVKYRIENNPDTTKILNAVYTIMDLQALFAVLDAIIVLSLVFLVLKRKI